jgi:dihydrofolate synthase/folylpolyglutamate synthase
MTYKESLSFLYEQLPMFQRIGSAAYKADLNNTIAICKALGNPEKKLVCVHIAGTNGKGSTSHFLASILQEAGYKVGLYTSPHLKDFRERIKINGNKITKPYVANFITNYKNIFEEINPSFFEMTVGLAFKYFEDKKIDIAIIETGLGGRLDSTNVITPVVSIITNISLDHTALLGNTIEEIAGEKAGIIKKNIPVIIGQKQVLTQAIFSKKAKALDAPIFWAEDTFKMVSIKADLFDRFSIKKNGVQYATNWKSGLHGLYQQKNIIAVLKAIEILQLQHFKISKQAIKNGLAQVVKNTGLMGRWQVLQTKPLCIADTGHNVAGIKEVLAQIKLTPHQQLHFVLGMVNDKDITEVLSLLPKNAIYYFCKANIPRGMEAHLLAEQANQLKLKGAVYGSVKVAYKAAKSNALKNDLVFIGGSTFTVAEVV